MRLAAVIDLRREEARRPIITMPDGEPPARFAEIPSASALPLGALALGVHSIDDGDGATGLAVWAYAAGVSVLPVAIGARVSRIGPLTAPGRVGCGHCARRRIAAAAPPKKEVLDDASAELRTGCELTDEMYRSLAKELAALDVAGAGPPCLDEVIVVDGETTPTRHRVVPLPRCPVCGGAARRATLELPDASATGYGAADPLGMWVDAVTGVIPALQVDQPSPASGDGVSDAPSLPVVITAAPPRIIEDSGLPRVLPAGWGKGLTPWEAVLSAVGEAIERYSASLPDPARLRWARIDDLDGDVLDPRQKVLYEEAQYGRSGFPFVRFDAGVLHPWVRGRWLDGGAPVWVPAIFAYLGGTVGPENIFCQGTSNGLATSPDPDDAALRATQEIVERDAFMSAWLLGTTGLRARIDDALDPRLVTVLENLQALGASIEIYFLPTSVCGATVLALALGDGERWPGVTLGLACHLDPARALRQAILELGQTGPYLRRVLRARLAPIPEDTLAVREMFDHALYYFPPDRVSAFDALRGGHEAIALHDLLQSHGDHAVATADTPAADALAACAASLRAAGVGVALVDVTSPDVALGNLTVVRAVSLDLQDISYGHGLDRAPVSRLAGRVRPTAASSIHPIW